MGTDNDLLTPEMAAKNAVVRDSIGNEKVWRNLDSSYIGTLYKRGVVNEQMLAAGMKVYSYWRKLGAGGTRGMDMGQIRVDGGGGGRLPVEALCDDRKALEAALRGLEPISRKVVLEVCCYETLMSDIQKDLLRERNVIPARLKDALMIIALNEGLCSPEQYDSYFGLDTEKWR